MGKEAEREAAVPFKRHREGMFRERENKKGYMEGKGGVFHRIGSHRC